MILLRTQHTSQLRDMIDKLIPHLNPVTSHPDRMPFCPAKIMVTDSRLFILKNHVGNAIINYGRFARNEPLDTRDLEKLEEIAANKFTTYGAFPKDKNSAIHVLRTVKEHRAEMQKWTDAAERSLNKKIADIDRQLEKEDGPD